MRSFLFYLVYYLTNHAVNRVPCHAFRLAWYRRVLGISIGAGSHVYLGVTFLGNRIRDIRIGERCMVNPGCLLNASDAIEIGNDVVLAHQVSLHTADHDVRDPSFAMRTAPIRVGDGAWLASHAIVLKGVTLGPGAVVAAGAVVARDVAPGQIVAGNPAQAIGERGAAAPRQPVTPHPWFC
jgi:maltose O-acetyltransferase